MKEAPGRTGMSSAESEDRFRQIFLTHLKSEGYGTDDAYRLIFKTPISFHDVPSDDHGLKLLDAFQESYQRQLAHAWFFEGLHRKPESSVDCLKAPERPVTFVVIPGIFGEFIEQLPFQSVVERSGSHFYRKWHAALEQATDSVYSLLELDDVTCSLAEVVKIGSLDDGDRSFANVIVLNARGGSLETLGSLASNTEEFQRRLTKTFDIIDDDTDIYLVGYSRGLAVALDLVSQTHGQAKRDELSPSTRAWFARVKGVIGLGGVYYGAGFARDVMSGKSGAASDLVQLLSKTADQLATVPDDASLTEKRKLLDRNRRVWADLVKAIVHAETPRVGAGKTFLNMDLEQVVARETEARIRAHEVSVPSSRGIFSLVSNFLLKTFDLKGFVARYNENVLALKQLVKAVIEGVETLTPASRDEWWRTHELPADLVLFSITGTMPDAYLDDFALPLWRFQGFGTKTSDYNVSLWSSYYDTLASESTLINDSQVSHYGSRYWEQMYPQHRYTHYYLGVLGTHHWGMAFPFTIADKAKTGTNAFPRAILLKSMASFISSLCS